MSDHQAPLPPGWIQQFDTNHGAYYYVDTTSPYPQPTWVHPSAGGYPCPPTTASNPYGEQLQQQHQDPYQQQHAPPPPSGSQQPGAWSSGQYGSTPGHDQYSSGNTTGQLATGYTAPPQQLGQQQDLYYTDATRTTTDTTDRGFGKMALTAGAGAVAMGLAMKMFSSHGSSSHHGGSHGSNHGGMGGSGGGLAGFAGSLLGGKKHGQGGGGGGMLGQLAGGLHGGKQSYPGGGGGGFGGFGGGQGGSHGGGGGPHGGGGW